MLPHGNSPTEAETQAVQNLQTEQNDETKLVEEESDGTERRDSARSIGREASHSRLTTSMAEAEDGSEDELSSETTVPSKRAATSTIQPMTSKQTKKRKTVPAQVSSKTAANRAVSQRTARPRAPRNSLGKRELKELVGKTVLFRATGGGRKTRLQKEEEAKNVPNAGRAAKARHQNRDA